LIPIEDIVNEIKSRDIENGLSRLVAILGLG
jgi:hypothetical protein